MVRSGNRDNPGRGRFEIPDRPKRGTLGTCPPYHVGNARSSGSARGELGNDSQLGSWHFIDSLGWITGCSFCENFPVRTSMALHMGGFCHLLPCIERPPEYRVRAARKRAQAPAFAGYSGWKTLPPERGAIFRLRSSMRMARRPRTGRVGGTECGHRRKAGTPPSGAAKAGATGPFAGHAAKTKPAAIPAVVLAAMPKHPAPAAVLRRMMSCRCPNTLPLPRIERASARSLPTFMRAVRPVAPLLHSRSFVSDFFTPC